MKQKIKILIMTTIIGVFLALIGTSYAYYQARVYGNTEEKSIEANTKFLKVNYTDGTSKMNFKGDFLFPGNTAEKTFTVKNTGDDIVKYNILIDNVVNEFERIQDLRYELYINEELILTGAINNEPIQYLHYNRVIQKNKTDNIKFIFLYSETEEIQNMDLNKTISFRFNIDSYLSNSYESNNNTLVFNSEVSNLNNYRIYGNSLNGENLFKYGVASDYSYEANPPIVLNSSISAVGASGFATFAVNNTKYLPGDYLINASFSGQKRIIVQLYDAAGSLLDNSAISLSGWTYNSYYSGWYNNKTPVEISIPENVASWSFGFGFFTGTVGEKATVSKVELTKKPTPDNPQEIRSVGGLSKNLLNPIFESRLWAATGSNISITNDVSGYSQIIKVEPNQTYTISGTFTGMNSDAIRIAFTEEYPAVGVTTVAERQQLVASTHNSLTITTPNNCNYILLMTGTSEKFDYTQNKIQIEKGTVATDYEPYGKYKIPVKVTNNLLKNIEFEQGTIYDATGLQTDSQTRVRTEYVILNEGTYTIRTDRTNNAFVRGMHVYNYETENWEEYQSFNTYNKTFDITKKSKVKFLFNTSSNDSITPKDILEENPILQLGTSIEEPFVTNIYIDEPLRKVGDYADYIDFKEQKIVRNIKYLDITGEEKWSTYLDNGSDTIIYRIGGIIDNGATVNILSNRFIGIQRNRMYSYGDIGISASGQTIRIHYPTITEDIDLFKEYLKNNSTHLQYVLASKEEKPIKLPTIFTKVGTNIIEIDTITAPSKLYIEY